MGAERDNRGPLIVCPNPACEGAMPLADGLVIEGMRTYVCPECSEILRLGSEHTRKPEVVDLRGRRIRR